MPIDVDPFNPATRPVNLAAGSVPHLGNFPEQWYLANILALLLQGYTLEAAGAAAEGPGTRVSSAVLEASKVLKGTPGILKGFFVFNNSASLRYIQLFDAAAVPADGTVPSIIPLPIPPGGVGSLTLPPGGIAFAAGICVSNSTTPEIKTISDPDCMFTAIVI